MHNIVHYIYIYTIQLYYYTLKWYILIYRIILYTNYNNDIIGYNNTCAVSTT